MDPIKQRNTNILPLADEVIDQWAFDVNKRKAATSEDSKAVTDMAAFMGTIQKYGLVINLPTYKAQGPATVRDDQIVVSKENRHGKVVGLVSHKDRFNFSVRIVDMNVMSPTEVGDYRTFHIVSDGVFWDGFNRIEFQPIGKEKELIEKLTDGSMQVEFNSFVSPSRWTSLYGSMYKRAKLLIARLSDELSYLRPIANEVRPKVEYTKTEVGETETKKVLKANFILPEDVSFEGEYPSIEPEDALAREKDLRKAREQIQFMVRATEWAFTNMLAKHAGAPLHEWVKTEQEEEVEIPKAAWAKDVVWVRGYQIPPRRKNKKYFLTMRENGNITLQIHYALMSVRVKKGK